MRLTKFIGAAVALGTLSLALPPIIASADTTAGTTNTAMVSVPGYSNPLAVPGTTVFGSTPTDTPETVSFVLDERNIGTLEADVEAGGSSYATTSQFAATYGQSPGNIAALESYLSHYGISTQVYSDDVDVVANGTAGEFDNALQISQDNYAVPEQPGKGGTMGTQAQTIHASLESPLLPSYLASFVDAILGLDNYSAFVSDAQRASSAYSQPKTSASACEALTGLADACNTPTNFEQNYNLSPIENRGSLGQGQTVGIVTLAALDVGAPEYYWTNVMGLPHSDRTVTVDNIDGGPGAPSDAAGTGETDLDVEQSGGVAPDANVIVYQAPNSDYGFADAFFAAASQNIAGSVSASWGESETIIAAAVALGEETPAYESAFDEAFLEMAAQGQSAFVSAGDAGAYDAAEDLGTTNLSVDYPGASPYVTSAGGTTMPWSGTFSGPDGDANVTVTAQRAWGWDYLWAPIAAVSGDPLSTVALEAFGGGGGGFSVTEATPSYQRGVSGTQSYHGVDYLQPTDYQDVDGIIEPTNWNFSDPPPNQAGAATGRAEPDLSADADPYSGYLLYSPSFAQDGDATLEGGWGGTSFVGPQLNGSTAVIESHLGHRVGFWNPSIYGFATSGSSPFSPLNKVGTSNDNLYFTGNPGDVYNPATGLGTPNLSALASDFANQR